MGVVAWVERLRQQTTSFRRVAGAAEYASLAPLSLPECYVIPLAEAGEANTLITGHRQRIIASVGVRVGVSNLRDPNGAQAAIDLEVLRAEVLLALLGWSPPGDCTPIDFVRGRLLSLDDQVLWWQDEFVTQFYREVP